METIKELYHKKKKYTRWLIVSSFIPLPGITLGFLIQLMKIDRDIEKEINNLDIKQPEVKYFVIKDNDNKQEQKS